VDSLIKLGFAPKNILKAEKQLNRALKLQKVVDNKKSQAFLINSGSFAGATGAGMRKYLKSDGISDILNMKGPAVEPKLMDSALTHMGIGAAAGGAAGQGLHMLASRAAAKNVARKQKTLGEFNKSHLQTFLDSFK